MQIISYQLNFLLKTELEVHSLFRYFQPAKISTIESLKKINLRNKLLQTEVAYSDSSYKT